MPRAFAALIAPMLEHGGAAESPAPVDEHDAVGEPHEQVVAGEPGEPGEQNAAAEPGENATAEQEAPIDEQDPAGERPLFPDWMPAPRAAAVAILLMLGLGVYTGSLLSPVAQTLAHQIVVAVSPPPAASTVASTPESSPVSSGGYSGGGGGGGSTGGGGGGGTTTIIQTITSPAPAGTTSGTSASGTGAGSGGGSSSTTGNGTSNPALHLPPVHHVFLIMLSDQQYFETFSPASTDHYLSHTLAHEGEVLQNYYSVAGSSLANGVAVISGQGPTLDTSLNCPEFGPIIPGTTGRNGQVIGGGCQYPSNTETIANQLASVHLTWKSYIQGVPARKHGKTTGCVYPQPLTPDKHATPKPGDPYVTWRNPFVYFSSLTDGSACRKDEVGLGHLAGDLKSAKTAPTLSYIIPSPCDDGSDTPCAPKAPAGLTAANRFLKKIVPEIKRSAAYKDNGLIAITFDQAPQTGPHADQSSCCDTPKYPNLPKGVVGPPPTSSGTSTTGTTTTTTTATPTPTTGTTTTPTPTTGTTTTTGTTPTCTNAAPTGTTTTSTTTTPTSTTPTATTTTPTGTTTTSTTATGTTTTPCTTTTPAAPTPSDSLGGSTKSTGGGGQVGILLISRFIKPNSPTDVFDDYNHFSLLASIEDLFGLPRLGYAANKSLSTFTSATFTAGS